MMGKVLFPEREGRREKGEGNELKGALFRLCEAPCAPSFPSLYPVEETAQRRDACPRSPFWDSVPICLTPKSLAFPTALQTWGRPIPPSRYRNVVAWKREGSHTATLPVVSKAQTRSPGLAPPFAPHATLEITSTATVRQTAACHPPSLLL